MPISKKDVDNNVSGDQKEIPLQEQEFSPSFEVPEKESSPAETWTIFKLVKHKKGSLHIDGIDDVMRDGRSERIWLLNGVTSIWQRDLLDYVKDKDFMRTSRRSLKFINGVCRIPSWDTLALEFARTTRHNVKMKGKRDASKQAFYEYDPAEQQRKMLADKMVRIKAINEASNMPAQDMMKHASFLGVVFIDELGRKKTEEGIRTEYIVRADENPTYWNQTKGTPEVDRMWLIKSAIIDSKIELGQGVIRWSNGGGFICHWPTGKAPQDCMLELAMSSTPEGKEFIQRLQT